MSLRSIHRVSYPICRCCSRRGFHQSEWKTVRRITTTSLQVSLSLSLSLSLSVTCRAGTLKRRVVQKPSISRHNVTRSERESDGGRTREEDTICSTGCGDQSETEEEEYSCHEPEVSRLLFHHESDEHCAVEFLVGVDWTRHRRGTMRVDSRERGRRRRK